jgi:hypothetical protein
VVAAGRETIAKCCSTKGHYLHTTRVPKKIEVQKTQIKKTKLINPNSFSIRRWCSPRAAPAEVEVLGTGVRPG